jgi:hypothetical protein
MINRAGNHFDLNRHEIPWFFGAAVAVAVRSVGGPPILEAGGVILDKIEGVLLELMDLLVIKTSSFVIDKAIKSRQIGHPRDIAIAVMFLVATPLATSSTVRVDGGGAIVRGHHA